MRHLKPYKIFESEDFDIEENIKELFLELQDEGFDIKVEPNYSSASRDKVFSYNVMIKKYWDNEDDMLTQYELVYSTINRVLVFPPYYLRDDSITCWSNGYTRYVL